MNLDEFEDWLDRLGEDVSRWPDPQRSAAEALLADSAAARDLLEEAKALREALAAPKLRAPAGLAGRILAEAGRMATESPAPTAAPAPPADRKVAVENTERPVPRSRWRLPLPITYRSRAAVLLPLCFVVGLMFGLLTHPEEAETDQVDLTGYVAHLIDLAHAFD
ncbi:MULTISPECIES: hypothetical protein [unclassified Bradyrhizobium]|uniref:hypothetical protein n=1 Tax=unclassified Bradyrhizobium TaxID=2631580 RepID=UPI0032E374E4